MLFQGNVYFDFLLFKCINEFVTMIVYIVKLQNLFCFWRIDLDLPYLLSKNIWMYYPIKNTLSDIY